MIVGKIASYPAREGVLKKSIKKILDQVERLELYLNDYSTIPEWLTKISPKLKIYLGRDCKGNLGDKGKFYNIEKYTMSKNKHLIFTFDDDILYPKNYVKYMSDVLNCYNYKCCVGVHGYSFIKPFSDYKKSRVSFHYRKSNKVNRKVDILGTGTTAFASTLYPLRECDFNQINMADIWLGLKLKQNKISSICVKRDIDWLQDVVYDMRESIFSHNVNFDKINSLVKKYF